MQSKNISFRLRAGSALERYLSRTTARTSDKLHELAAAHEAVMRAERNGPSQPVALLAERLGE